MTTFPGDSRGAATAFTARGERHLVITRTLPAPRELVFAAWTDAAHLPHWLGRRDWTMTVCVSDPRPGGVRRFVWRHVDGTEMGVGGVYRAVAAPRGLVCTESFDGAPGSTLNTLHLVERDGMTTVTSRIRYPSGAARDSALATNMRAGVDDSLTRLAQHLDLAPSD